MPFDWGIAGSLLGGLLGKSKGVSPATQSFGHTRGLMLASERFGINPLTLLGAGIPGGHTAGDNSALGSAIADAGMLMADKMAKRQDAQKLNQLERQNNELTKKMTRMTLRPEIPGVYDRGGNNGGPNGPVSDAVHSSSVSDRGGPRAAVVDPARYNWLDPEIRSGSDDASRVPEKPLYLGGIPLEPQTGTSDAEAIGTRYGEDFLSPSWFAGWGAFAGDALLGAKDYASRRIGTITSAFRDDLKRYKRHAPDMESALGREWWKHQFPQ